MTDQLSITRGPQDDRHLGAKGSDVANGMARIFHDIFDVEVGQDDDFFELGGDSLAGETLVSGIERDFGVALPLSILLESSTPRALAAAVAAKLQAARPSILFTVNNAGSRTPLFCIHGGTGTATFSRKIRDVLPDRPIYAVRALGLLPGEIPLISAPEMARSYIGEIRKVRPSGPYHIFGQCSTANVAYEVAQQLSAAGEQVNTVTLGDPKRLRRRLSVHRLCYWLVEKRAVRTARRFPHMTGDQRWHKIMSPALVTAEKDYVPRPYSGRVLIAAASSNVDELLHPERGYPALVPHLETAIIKGKHLDVFTGSDGKASGELARAMSSFLARHD